MRIHSIRIQNFRQFNDSVVNFCDEDGIPRACTVVVGPNMSGKTTVLDAIHLAYEALAPVGGTPTFRPGFQPDHPAARRDPRAPILLELTFSLQNQELDVLVSLAKDVDVRCLPPRSETYVVKLRWPSQGPAVWGGEPTDGWKALCGRQLLAMGRARGLATQRPHEVIGGLLYMHQERTTGLRTPSVDTAPEEALRERAVRGDAVPWLEFVSRLDSKWPERLGESAWRRVRRLYGGLAQPAEIADIEASDDGFDLRLEAEGRSYYASGMSSGEKQLLGFVVRLAAFRARNSVVLMDEAELHLHPQWQRNLLQFCRRGGEDENQFILTTHSESILKLLDASEVVELGQLVQS